MTFFFPPSTLGWGKASARGLNSILLKGQLWPDFQKWIKLEGVLFLY